MSRVDDLMKKLCPNGVVFEEIGAVVEIKNGKDWKTERPGKIPVFGSGGQMDVYVQEASCVGPSVLLPRKGSLAVQFVDVPFWNVDTVFYTKCNPEQLDIKYFYYVMERVDLSRISTSSTRPSITQTALKKLVIPVPPLEIQQEIARILDKFTQLEAELEAELEARRKQSAYFRDQFFDHDSPFYKASVLGKVGEFRRGSSFQKKHIVKAGIPCIHYGEIYTHYGISAKETKSYLASEFAENKRLMEPGEVFIATTSENDEDLGKAVAWIGAEPVVPSNDGFVYSPVREQLDPQYVSYFLSSGNFQNQKRKHVTGAKVRRLSKRALESIEIPLPPLEEQRRIVAILDKFDALVNDISTGLPAEIAARRKQYEYYRDKLLSFEPV